MLEFQLCLQFDLLCPGDNDFGPLVAKSETHFSLALCAAVADQTLCTKFDALALAGGD